MKIGCQIGILDTKDVQGAIASVGEAGFGGIELFEPHIVPYYADPSLFKGLLDRAGIALAGVYFNSDRFIDRRSEDQVLERAIQACDFMRTVGCGYLLLNGGVQRAEGDRFSDDDWAQMARIANRIAQESRKRVVQTVLHPHFRCMIETCQDVDRLIDAGLNQNVIGLCVHAGHQLLRGVDPYEIYNKYMGWVRYIHVGNQDEGGKGAFLGEGVLDQVRLHQPIFEAGYDGWIVVECRKQGVSAREYCDNARDYLKSQWPDLNWE